MSTASAMRARAACSEPSSTTRGRHLKLPPTPPMLLGHPASVSAAAVLPNLTLSRNARSFHERQKHCHRHRW
ncbi:hypothetical protein XAP6164_5410003 [Xanthomonas phaseoli pv. phaseoli]|nr:hypothetical protein XAP6164_5410003 [Xanthomonas phaseoli pv. phaseoli]